MRIAFRALLVLTAFLTCAVGLCAETLDGIVLVKKKLTRLRVTAPIPMYERGPIVALGGGQESDPLAFERSRVVVYLEGRFPTVPSAGIVQMQQVNRQFEPEIIVIEAGSKVSFPNLDPIFHNVFSLSAAKTLDLGNYPKGETRTVTFSKPGIININCHLHSNMSAAIVVAPNRWNARVARDGRFTFQDVPPGQYTVVAWHKAAGFFRQPVQIEPGRAAHVEFLVPLDEDGRKLEPLAGSQ